MGTVYYVSPEMLSDNISTPSSDLWALGCILFRMFYGKVPFNGTNDYQTFQLILERKLDFPEDTQISEDAKDLIERLLQKDPEQRLGSGKDGSELDYTHLKNHQFFKEVQFGKLHTIEMPVSKKYFDLE